MKGWINMKITKKSRTLALGMAIGDGTINKNGYLAIRHSIKQKEYLEWKRKLLKINGFNCTEVYYCNNNGYCAYEFRTFNNKSFLSIRKLLYKNSKKSISLKALNRLTGLELAIWYMDNGSITTDSRRSILTISTCVTKEENQVIIDYLNNKWDISFGQRKMKNSYALICGTKEARKFIKIVEPFLNQIECMKYKLNVKQY